MLSAWQNSCAVLLRRNAAWIFAIPGLISSVANSISSIKSDVSASGVVSAILSIALSVLILLAAGKVREALKNEQ